VTGKRPYSALDDLYIGLFLVIVAVFFGLLALGVSMGLR